ncbi:MAG: molybdopterin-dependent oxidoreductase [candidate division WOR-3 bacterium]|nr:molybdopterin-dependent oxidoreductase [candidate division WOR-3 bacterium]
MIEEPRTLTMEINHRNVSFPEGVTVHRAAELAGVYIPSLCSHKDLSPFGGCRLCMVEIEGMRGYPLSCSTTAQEGMKVLTDTAALRELRAEILKLILSEHPSSCLVCGEKDECRDYQGTIRKTGVTTGCRFCPNDGQCELQDVVEKVGLTEIDFPIYYHGYEPEHDDPFYDRDYNICILCGRCVRMCQEVRGTGVLAFTYRGPRAKIGPAFGRNHVEAGCEFCGACVDVCPTGALADKASKWDGKPDGSHVSTCPFCPVGCQLELDHKDGRLSKARANLDPEINDGQLCVKGRFCMPEVTHHFERAKKPMLQKGDYFREVSWQEALEKVAAELKGIRPGEFLMLVSPDLTNESLFAAQKFVRDCIGSNGIDSTARMELAGGLGLWSELFSLPISIKDVARADVILAVGLDTRFNFSVVGTRVRKALARGARLVTIDARDSNLARYTDDWLRPLPGTEGLLLKFLADSLAGRPSDASAVAKQAVVETEALTRVLEIVSASRDLTVIIGPQVFHYANTDELASSLLTLAERPSTNFMPLYFGANARGALEMGVFPEIDPGGSPRKDMGLSLADVTSGSKEVRSPKFELRSSALGASVRPKVIYLVGDVPFVERPDCDFLIVQDIYLPSFKVDAFLPAATFAETGGTLVNMEGRVQEIIQIESQPEGPVTGFMRPDWQIFSDLAGALQYPGMNYRTSQDVDEDIHRAVPDFPLRPDRMPRRMKTPTEDGRPKTEEPRTRNQEPGTFLLVAEPAGYRHRGIDISSKVGGLGELALEEGFRMNPEDIASLGVADCEQVTVSLDKGDISASGPVKSNSECPKGVVYYTRPVVFGGLGHRRALWPLFRLAENPVRVSVIRHDASGITHNAGPEA